MPPGREEIFDVSLFKTSSLVFKGMSVFTNDLAVYIYKKLADASINPGSPDYLSTQIGFCTRVKNQIEKLIYVDESSLKDFLRELNTEVEKIKPVDATYFERESQFYNTAKNVQALCCKYLKECYRMIDQEFSERVLETEEYSVTQLPPVIGKFHAGPVVRVSDYITTKIITKSLISNDSAQEIYAKLVDMSMSCGETTQLYRHGDCLLIKENIERVVTSHIQYSDFHKVSEVIFCIRSRAITEQANPVFIQAIDDIFTLICQQVRFRYPEFLKQFLTELSSQYRDKVAAVFCDCGGILVNSTNAIVQIFLLSLPWIILGSLIGWGGACDKYSRFEFLQNDDCVDRMFFPGERAQYSSVTSSINGPKYRSCSFWTPVAETCLQIDDLNRDGKELCEIKSKITALLPQSQSMM